MKRDLLTDLILVFAGAVLGALMLADALRYL
jgi:hypothetical protein